MKNQLLIVGLIAVTGASALKADRFYQIFEKPYRQEAALAASSALLLGGGYKFARSVVGRRPVGTLLSMGALSAGSLGVLIAEGNSKYPKLITNERFPRLAGYGEDQYRFRLMGYGIHRSPNEPRSPHAALEGAMGIPSRTFNRGLNGTMSAFDRGMDKAGVAFDRAKNKTEAVFASARTKTESTYSMLKAQWQNFRNRN